MSKFKNLNKLILILIVMNFGELLCKSQTNLFDSNLLTKKSFSKEKLIPFSFKDKNLIDLASDLVKFKNSNLVLPVNPAYLDTLKKQKVNYNPHEAITLTLAQAWKMLLLFLELSGFTIIKTNKHFFEIVKIKDKDSVTTNIALEPLPLYVDIKPKDLPDSDQVIRYIGYLKNLKVPQAGQKESPVSKFFDQIKSINAGPVLYFPQTNGFLLTEKSNIIRSLIFILQNIDSENNIQALEHIPLSHISASEVSLIFDLLEKAIGTTKKEKKKRLISYFAAGTQVIPYEQNNSIVLLGDPNILIKLKDFITANLDTPSISGKSFLHVYNLQYLDAQAFAQQLNDILKSQPPEARNVRQGYFDFYGFRGPVVVAEESQKLGFANPAEQLEEFKAAGEGEFSDVILKGIKGRTYTGGNRLLIAAFDNDWIRIKNLIKKLDVPQPQVILELLFVDFINERDIEFSGTIRNRVSTINNDFGFLSSNISGPTPVIGTNPTTLVSDFLGAIGPGENQQLLLPLLEPGSLILSFNDPETPGVFALLKILNQYFNFKILSHPFIYASNHQKAQIEQSEVRRANGPLVPVNGSYTILVENVEAQLSVKVIPHVADDKTVKLNISIEISEFKGNIFARRAEAANVSDTENGNQSNLDRVVRALATTATLEQGQTLVLGGLMRTDQFKVQTQTPIIGSIPLIGRFFKGERVRLIQNTISLFVTPIITSPRNSEVLSKYAQEKIEEEETYREIPTEIINYKEPITKLFFAPEKQNLRDNYLQQSKNLKVIAKPYANSDTTNALKELLNNEENPIVKLEMNP